MMFLKRYIRERFEGSYHHSPNPQNLPQMNFRSFVEALREGNGLQR